MPRVKIDNLPVLEDLSADKAKGIFGGASLSKLFGGVPGIKGGGVPGFFGGGVPGIKGGGVPGIGGGGVPGIRGGGVPGIRGIIIEGSKIARR